MAMQNSNFSRKSIIYLGIMILCLLTGIDDISGFWRPFNGSGPLIQSGSGQDNGEDNSFKSVFTHPAWRDAIDVAQRRSFSQAYLEEIKWQIGNYLSPAHNRAPPSLFIVQAADNQIFCLH
jgi:hypothetical protein